MRKDFPLAEETNEIITRAIESGLFSKWMSDSVILQKQKAGQMLSKKLQIDHIIGALLIYLLFISFAFSAFFAENIVYKRVQQRTNFRFWKTAEYLLDDDRHEFLFLLVWKWIRRENISMEEFDCFLEN